jgi:hypothetical protein
MSSQREVIETTASNVAAELARRGIGPDDRVTITIEPDQELIKQAQKEVEPLLG